MLRRTMFVVAVLSAASAERECFGQGLLMGMDNVGWENANASGPLLYREVPEANLLSVRAKISAQTVGFWSLSGVIVRAPNLGAGENWQASWSFRGAAPFIHQSNSVTNSVEAEAADGGLTADELTYVRLDNLGGGTFQAYRGTGPDDAIVWTPVMDDMMMPEPQTNVNLSGATLQVGIASGIAPGASGVTGAGTLYDWAEIHTTSEVLRDDFDYTRDLGTDGVLPGGIWTGILNGTVGGINTQTGPDLGRCLICNWDVDGSGDMSAAGNWVSGGAPGPLLFLPGGTDTTLVFGAAAMTNANNTAYANQNVTAAALSFDNAMSYNLGGPGSITLESAAGNAAINVVTGAHEIQVDLILNDDLNVDVAAGTVLDVNSSVHHNGHTVNLSGTGTLNCNNNISCFVGSGGAGSLVNGTNLSGLEGFGGDFAQTAGGSLDVEAGGGAVSVGGEASLAGTLNVALADGFVPTRGESYTVLTAGSVTDQGLTLGGPAADLFRLSVGPNAVSLVAVGVPEPATVVLASLGLIVGGSLRRRRGPPQRHSGHTLAMHRFLCASAALTLWIFGTSAATADTLTFGPGGEDVTYRDDFNDFFDYYAANGGVPANTLTSSLGGTASWTATHNSQNGGLFDGTPANFEADGGVTGIGPRPDVLTIVDYRTHPNASGLPEDNGTAWEPPRNNAPLLFANVNAGDNFEAVTKIDAQTAGFWSMAGIVVRLAGPGVGRGAGETFEPTESFIYGSSFRVDMDDPETPEVDESLTARGHTEIVINGAGAGEGDTVGALVGLPTHIRVTKQAARFTLAGGVDDGMGGITWTDIHFVNNTELNTPGELLEVGPSFSMFPIAGATDGSGAGWAEFDYFEITVKEQLVHNISIWNAPAANASGNWNTGNNWDSPTHPGVIPNANTVNVQFLDRNAAVGPATVFNNLDIATGITVRSLAFDSPNTYAISGAGRITLEPDASSLVDTDATFINVDEGSHQIDLDLRLSSAAANDNRITAQPGTRLDINNTLDINGKQLFVQGGGRVNINNNIDTGTTGTVFVAGGNLGGSGRVNGALTNGTTANPGGIVAPGTSVGTLTVDGNYTQHATGTLAIELGGLATNQFDRLAAGALANLNGLVDVQLVNDFLPNVGDMFTILTATNIVTPGAGISLHSSDSPYYSLICNGCNNAATQDTLVLRVDVQPPPPGVAGDYNGNMVVDAADYTFWRDRLGQNIKLPNTDPNDTDNMVTMAEYDFWKSRFGATSGSGSGASAVSGTAVPEPSSAVLLLLAIALLRTARGPSREPNR